MWLLILVLPWFVAIFWRAGDTFLADSIGGDMLSKLAAQESHGAPPGLYLYCSGSPSGLQRRSPALRRLRFGAPEKSPACSICWPG